MTTTVTGLESPRIELGNARLIRFAHSPALHWRQAVYLLHPPQMAIFAFTVNVITMWSNAFHAIIYLDTDLTSLKYFGGSSLVVLSE